METTAVHRLSPARERWCCHHPTRTGPACHIPGAALLRVRLTDSAALTVGGGGVGAPPGQRWAPPRERCHATRRQHTCGDQPGHGNRSGVGASGIWEPVPGWLGGRGEGAEQQPGQPGTSLTHPVLSTWRCRQPGPTLFACRQTAGRAWRARVGMVLGSGRVPRPGSPLSRLGTSRYRGVVCPFDLCARPPSERPAPWPLPPHPASRAPRPKATTPESVLLLSREPESRVAGTARSGPARPTGGSRARCPPHFEGG